MTLISNLIRIAAFGLAVLFVGQPALGRTGEDALDRVYLRDGTVRRGIVTPNRQTGYIILDPDSRGVESIPKQAVRFVVYDESRPIEERLNLKRLRGHCSDPQTGEVTFLPTKSYGEELVTQVENAQHSIWVLAYYLSGSRVEPISTFYRALRERARAGVDVVLVAPFGAGTTANVKETTLNFANELRADGVEVLYIQEAKVQHKKLLIVDGATVLLGSSNLTSAGVRSNNEMNVRISRPAFVKEAINDFQGMRKRAVPQEELRY